MFVAISSFPLTPTKGSKYGGRIQEINQPIKTMLTKSILTLTP